MSEQSEKAQPEEGQEEYAKPKVHTHEPLRDLTGSGPYRDTAPTNSPTLD